MRQNETITIIKQRRSIRNYRAEQVVDAEIDMILQAGLYAPHGGGAIEQDIYFTVVQNENMLRTINKAAKEFAKQSEMPGLQELGNDENFNCLYNAPTLIIISCKKDSVCAVYDCSAVTQNMLLASESLGLGSCWLYFPLQAFETECGGELAGELKIPQEYKPITSLIIGYKADDAIDTPERKTENVMRLQ
jgi:nitroreductase